MDKPSIRAASWFLEHFLRQLRVQHFHIIVHSFFTKPCVRSVDKPRELLCTPAFLAVTVLEFKAIIYVDANAEPS